MAPVVVSPMTKPYYQDDYATIYHGDCREIDWPEHACAVFSPPYNVDLGYDQHDDNLDWTEYRHLAQFVLGDLKRSMIEGGRVWINTTPVVPASPLPAGDHSGRGYNPRVSLLNIWTAALESAGLGIWDYVAWTTPGRGPGTAWGSWQSPAGPNMRGEWETIIAGYLGTWGRSTPAKWKGWQDNIGGWTSLVSNVWRMQPESRGPEGHPAPFPVELARRCIRLSTWPGETVVDPFMGSGTTLVAARELGRKVVGADISERYCEIAAKRLAQEAFDFGGAA